ncbi:SpoIIE family protein phosphatase [bacterium]|nr:SpoIIE family protein phosphatase [bacterium]
MSLLNQDLQATHQILSLLENSKSLTDRIFDQLPGVFAVVDAQGNILRANQEVAKYIGVDHELLLGRSLSSLFKEETWNQFKDRLIKIDSGDADSEIVEFELAIDIENTQMRSFIWQIFSFEFGTRLSRKLYTCIGRDISDLKKAMSEVYTLAKDLEVTGAVQTLLLPKDNTFTHKNVKLAAYYEAANQSGGDWWWYTVRPDGSLVIILGDVTGHGAGSAMVTALMAGAYQSLAKALPYNPKLSDLPTLFGELNESLKSFCESQYWMTMSALEIPVAQNEAKWWTAAAPPIYVLRANSDLETMVGSGTPVGSKILTVGSDHRTISKGDRIFIFTDGAYEFNMANDRQFGLKRLRNVLLHTRSMDTEKARDYIAEEIKKAMVPGPAPDDNTFIVVDFI